MKYLDLVKSVLPGELPSMHTKVAMFHVLIGKKPTPATIRITKAYIDNEILYEDLRIKLKLK